MKEKYKTELEAMRDFYEELEIMPDYSCSTDGRISGTLIEIKLNNSAGTPLKQLKRYITAYNSAALPIPLYSLFININQRKYVFINNNNWKTIDAGKWKDPKDLLGFLNKSDYLNGWIDEFSIVAYNDLFYSKYLSSKKDDFIEEIKKPKELRINPYNWDKTGEMERGILDCLGSQSLKKRLGAFFTPDEYVKISTEYLRNTISRIPEDYDYIILDRCAGTGNLEKFLTKEELSHCILNTYVYAEWTTLKGLYEGRVRCIIPHTKDHKDPDGLLSDGDALTEEFDNLITDIIVNEKEKANNKLVIIGLENPPYSEPQAEATRSGKTHKQSSWTKEQMKKDKSVKGASTNDLANQFIWSMTRKYTDEYIVFAPIKYWKTQHLFDGKFKQGHLCNRKKFHATEAAISLISWTLDNGKSECLNLQSDLGNREVKKIHKGIISLNPESINSGFTSLYHVSGTPDFKNGALVNSSFNKHCRKIELSSSNIFQTLPLWVANCYKPKDYTEKEVIMKSGDGGTAYQEDKDFLNDCFVWSCLTNANKCVSTDQIRNELCLLQGTESDKLLDIGERHTEMLERWYEILETIRNDKRIEEYNSKFTYGLHQICKDINIKIETGDYNKKGEPIKAFKHGNLNSQISSIKDRLNRFYNKYITEKLFKYQLLK